MRRPQISETSKHVLCVLGWLAALFVLSHELPAQDTPTPKQEQQAEPEERQTESLKKTARELEDRHPSAKSVPEPAREELPAGTGVLPAESERSGSGRATKWLSEHGARAKAQYEKQLVEAEQAVAMNPDDAEAHHNLGAVYYTYHFYTIAHLDQAIAEYRKAIDLEPKFVRAYYSLGWAYLRQGKLDQAKAAWKKSLELQSEPQTIIPKLLGGLDYAQKRIEACKGMVAARAGSAEAYYRLGRAYGDAAQEEPSAPIEPYFDQAIAAWEQAIALDPSHAESYRRLGRLYADRGDTARAVTTWEKAIKLKPNDPETADVYLSMGNLYQSEGRIEEAVAAYDKAIAFRFHPADFLGSQFLATEETLTPEFWSRYLEKGRRDEERWADAIVRHAQDAEAYYHLGEAYAMQALAYQTTHETEAFFQARQKAQEAYQQALRLGPGYAEPYRALGDLNLYLTDLSELPLSESRYDEAIRHYRKAVELKPDDARLYYKLGVAYVMDSVYVGTQDKATLRQRRSDAIAAYQKTIAMNPNSVEAHHALAMAYLMTDPEAQNYNLAWKHLREVQRLGGPVNQATLTDILSKLPEQSVDAASCW